LRESEIVSRAVLLDKLAATSAPIYDDRLEAAGVVIKELQKELEEVKERLESLAKKNGELERLSITDQLTGLYNQRYFYDILHQELVKSIKQEHPLCLLFFDVDGLKTYNDTYGHIGGNEVLKVVAQSLSENLGDADSGYRYGGDEFAAILPKTSVEQAVKVARNINKSLRKTDFQYVSLSFGVVELTSEMDSETFLGHADEAMYMAKKLGMNMSGTFIDKIYVYAGDIIKHKPLREPRNDTRY
jgi:diguanylate cyclase (GGDEF)-like protein